jgi:hypothetical protein
MNKFIFEKTTSEDLPLPAGRLVPLYQRGVIPNDPRAEINQQEGLF